MTYKFLVGLFFIFLLFVVSITAQSNSFIKQQQKHLNVRAVYSEKDSLIRKQLNEAGLRIKSINILIIAYKDEKQLELWIKKRSEKIFKLLNIYSICTTSGTLGPKRREWDSQIPEGFYHVASFNPASSFFLSLCINYPNRSDRILSPYPNLGDAICIHGGCATIGCLPIEDEFIRELYIYAIEARNNGQSRIPVYIFPKRLNEENYNRLRKDYRSNIELLIFWENLKEGYDRFESSKEELRININRRGKYIFN